MLARKTVLILGTNAIGALTGMVSLFFIGRYMTPAAYGMFGFAIGIIGVMVFFAEAGFDRAHLKRVSEGRDLGDCLKTYAVAKTLLVTLFCVIALTATLVWEHTRGFHDAVTLPVILVVILFYLATETRKYFEMTFNALRQTARTQALNLVDFTVKTPLLVVVALAFGYARGRWVPAEPVAAWGARTLGWSDGVTTAEGAVMIAFAWVAGMAASMVVAFGIFAFHRYPVGRFRRGLMWDYVRFALPIAIPAILSVIAVRIDSVMIGYFWADRDVGHYFASQRIMTMLMVLPSAVGTLFFPFISQLAGQGQREGVREVATTTQRLMSLVMVPAVMLILVLADKAVHIFLSDSYLPAAPILRVLALYALTVSFCLVASSIVWGFDHPEKTALAGTLNLLTNLSLNFLLIPTSVLGIPGLGMRGTGAALATLAGQVVFLVIVTYYAWRYTGRFYIGRSIAKHGIAATVTGVLLHLAIDPLFGTADRVWELGAAVAAAGLLYLLLLVVMREIGRKDYLMVVDLLDVRKMAGYVRSELTSRDEN